MIRNLLDKVEPHFHKGGKWEKDVRALSKPLIQAI